MKRINLWVGVALAVGVMLDVWGSDVECAGLFEKAAQFCSGRN